MSCLPFFKFSPSGNDTLFLLGKSPPPAERARLCRQALTFAGGEQAGFVEPEQALLSMAAGEFCVNACRAMGALLSFLSPDDSPKQHYTARISALSENILLETEGRPPVWQCSASFGAPAIRVEKEGVAEHLVSLPGIGHLFVETDVFPPMSSLASLAGDYFSRHGMDSLPAAGVVWWRQHAGVLEILPFVQVPAAGTAILENACGSACLGLAALLDSSDCPIKQPSGDILQISRRGRQISVTGLVRLVCEGRIWLDG